MIEVLVVDDDFQLLEMLEIALKSAGYKVLTAFSGEEACRTVELLLPDIVLLDLNLPGKSGFEVCRHIRSTITDTYIPVIILTA
ncbi:response regulator, partial [bacterium]|nr:response regulator [bacterium]